MCAERSKRVKVIVANEFITVLEALASVQPHGWQRPAWTNAIRQISIKIRMLGRLIDSRQKLKCNFHPPRYDPEAWPDPAVVKNKRRRNAVKTASSRFGHTTQQRNGPCPLSFYDRYKIIGCIILCQFPCYQNYLYTGLVCRSSIKP